jgi:hypothetical protein
MALPNNISSPLGRQIHVILAEELATVTVERIVKEKCQKIGKTPDTIAPEDLTKLVPLLMGPVLLFCKKENAQIIKGKLDKLIPSAKP